MGRLRTAIGVTLVYVALTLVMTHPLINLSALGSACYVGDARLMIWTFAWDNHAVLDHVPLFSANMFYPAVSSLDHTEHLFGISLFTLPLYAATRNPILAYNVIWLLAFLLNGLAMHALVFHYTRRHLAGLAGGVIYAFSFYNMLHATGHVQLIWTWLIPLSLLLGERWTERPTITRAALWGGAVILQALGSWYIAVMVLVANATLLAWRYAVGVRDQWRMRAAGLVLVTVVAAAAIVPFAVHYRALAAPTRLEVARLSADWASYLVPPENTLVGQLWLAHVGAAPRGIWGEQTLFLGWLATALGVIGLVAMFVTRTWRQVGGYMVLTIAGLALSFGPHMPRGSMMNPFDVLALLPSVVGIRAPARFAVLVLLGLAVLAGTAVAALQRRFGRRAEVTVALLIPVMLCEWFAVKLPQGQPQRVSIPAMYTSDYLRHARAYVSLPDYYGTPNWFLIPDYLLFSTALWRPIVNGYGRSEPEGYFHLTSHMTAFPGPNNARTMRALGVEYVVLDAARYPDGAAHILPTALASPEYELVEHSGTNYLFRVRPAPK